MAIPANIAIAWPSTVASIPAGWSRVTELDSMYIVGASTGADTDLTTPRGNATHTHTSPSHTPIQDPHTHSFSANPDGAPTGNVASSGLSGAAQTHIHAAINFDSLAALNDSVAITVNSVTNDLSYTDVIWLKSDGTPTVFPIGCGVFFESDSLPTNWSRAAGGTYIKGAVTSSGGNHTGGSNTHSHTSPAHTHTQQAHNHANFSDVPDSAQRKGAGTTTTVATGLHVHMVTSSSVTAINQAVTTTISTSNHEPPFYTINFIVSTAAELLINAICLWLGSNANIPTGWARYTALDSKWIKCSSANGQVGTTGGSSQHTHTASDCQPVQNSHTHTATDSGGSASTKALASGANNLPTPAHTHTWSVSTTTATNQATSVSIDTSSVGAAYPPYRTVIFVQLQSVGPVVPLTGITTYDIMWPPNGMNMEQLGGKPTPEVQHKRWIGDHRYYPDDPPPI